MRLILLAVAALMCWFTASIAHAQNDYKVPDGYIKAPFDGFTGVLMLQPHRASGMFVAYIEGNEPVETLRARLLDRIGGMFLHETTKKPFQWTNRSLASRVEDGNGEALMSLYQEGDKQLQIQTYERKTGPRPFLYGYFAMRHRTARKDDGEFLDVDGKGVKAFEKLWKSFGK